jgi:hypothetical protein
VTSARFVTIDESVPKLARLPLEIGSTSSIFEVALAARQVLAASPVLGLDAEYKRVAPPRRGADSRRG